MKGNIVTFGLASAIALALSTTAPLAQPSVSANFHTSSPLTLVRMVGGGGFRGLVTQSRLGRPRLDQRVMPPSAMAPPMQRVPQVAPLAPRIGQ